MNLIKKIIIAVSIITVGFLSNIQSQDDNYTTAMGIRGGNPTGFTYKHFIGRFGVLEGIAGINFSFNDPKKLAFAITGLYEYHMYLAEGWNAYVGGGLSIGAGQKLFFLNADAIIGLEYTFYNFPINISIDYKPYYSPFHRNLIGVKGAGFNEFGLSVRYVILR